MDPTSNLAPKYIYLSLCLQLGNTRDNIDNTNPNPDKLIALSLGYLLLHATYLYY